jgi:flagellar hook-length control protein FliK
MITQPAGAAVAALKSGAGLGATSADGARSGGAEAPCTSAATTATVAPFSLTLQALSTGPDTDGPLLPGAGLNTAQAAADTTDTESPPNDAVVQPKDMLPKDMLPNEWLLASTAVQPGTSAPQLPAADPQATKPAGENLFTGANSNPPSTRARTASARQPAAVADPGKSAGTRSAAADLPKDLMRALFAKDSARPAQIGAQQSRAAGADDEHRSGSAAGDAPAGDALLAAVLQWLQPARSDVGDSGSSASGASTGQASDADPMSATAEAHDAHQGLSAAVAGMTATPPGKPLVSPLLSQRDAQSQLTSVEAPRLPRELADDNAAVGGMNMAAALRATNAANPAPAEHSVAVPVHDRHWPTAMAAQVLILSSDKVRAATLRLSPEHLGPVEVHIDMQDSNVNVNFTAAHAETRAALEQAMPQLRTVLAGAGLTLGQATVQQQARRESQNSNALARAGSAADEPIEAPIAVTRSLGMIDEYV